VTVTRPDGGTTEEPGVVEDGLLSFAVTSAFDHVVFAGEATNRTAARSEKAP
jgi:hypothetical protein